MSGWREDAACAQVGGDLWFPERGEQSTAARRLCMTCPVQVACLQWALAHEVTDGVWGGMTQDARRRLLQKRRAAAWAAGTEAA